VVATGDLREPLRARRAARRLPITVVIGLAHDLREPLREARLLLTDRAHLAATRVPATLTHLIDRPIHESEHTFVSYQLNARQVCRDRANLQGYFAYDQ
jgi:hypothetical protein